MNILEIEDMIKGLPDQALQREAQMPSGQVPQFLVVSEIQRRGDMRKRFSERQPQGTVKDQVIQEGIAAMAPPEPQMQAAMMGMQQPMPQAMQQPMPQAMQQPMPMDQPPMGMFEGGVVQMANGLQVPGLQDKFKQAKDLGLGYQEAIDLASKFGLSDFINTIYSDDSEMANIQANVGTPAYQPASMAPRDIPFGREFEEDSMLDRATSFINQALAPPPATGGRSVGNLFGSDMPAPTNVSGAAPTTTEVPTEMPEENLSIVDRINQIMAGPELTEEQKAFASQRRPVMSRGPYGAVRSGMGSSGAESIDYDLSGSRMSAYQDIVAKTERGEPLTMGERTALPSYREEFGSIQSDINPQTAGPLAAAFQAAGIDIPGVDTQRINIIELAEQSLREQGLPGSQAQDISRLDEDDAGQETQELAEASDSTASLSGTPKQVVPGANTAGPKDTPTEGAGGGAKQGTGSTLLSGLDQRIAAYKTALTGEGSGALKTLTRSNTLADAIRGRERPGLDYTTLIKEYEDQMRPEMEALSRERGSQALLALGAGIAKGDLSAGLSGAAKAAAASNAERRALMAKQQAAQMGLKKAQIDATYQNSLDESEDEIKALTVEVNALKDFGLTQAQAEKAAFQQGAAYDLAIAKLEQDGTLQRARDERDEKKQQNLLRTAALDGAKEYLRTLDEMTVESLGSEGLLDLYNRTASELAARLGVGFEGVDTVKGSASAPKSIGGYSVSESP